MGKVFAAEAWRPKLRPPSTHTKVTHMAHAHNPSTGVMETWKLMACQSDWNSEHHVLWETLSQNNKERQKMTPEVDLCSLHALTLVSISPTHTCTHWHTTLKYINKINKNLKYQCQTKENTDVFIYFMVLGMESRGPHSLDKCSTTELHTKPPDLFIEPTSHLHFS